MAAPTAMDLLKQLQGGRSSGSPGSPKRTVSPGRRELRRSLSAKQTFGRTYFGHLVRSTPPHTPRRAS